jgi:hypothetical protein
VIAAKGLPLDTALCGDFLQRIQMDSICIHHLALAAVPGRISACSKQNERKRAASAARFARLGWIFS